MATNGDFEIWGSFEVFVTLETENIHDSLIN